MLLNLLLATVMAGTSVLLHFGGLSAITAFSRRYLRPLHAHESLRPQAFVVLATVIALAALHSIEIWTYAFVFHLLNPALSFAEALYFSISTYTTLGYGDIVLGHEWRVFGATEAMIGLLLIGWSTAFLLSVSGRLRVFAPDA